MATVVIPKIAAYYVAPTGETIQGIRYGRYVDIIGREWRYDCYIMYDCNVLLRSQLSNIMLRRTRSALDTMDGSGFANYTLYTFNSKDSSRPQILPDIANTNHLYPNKHISNDTLHSGQLDLDITDIFNINNAVSGMIGTYFSYTLDSYALATDSDAWLEAIVTQLLPYAPVGLQPTTSQNPKGPIRFSWVHTPNPQLLANDPQIASQIEISQSGGTTITQTISGTLNYYILPANTYTSLNTLTFRVRTQTQYNGWGAWSSLASVPLSVTQPLAPVLVFPVGISVNAESGILLEFEYRSLYDTTPTGFTVRYRIQGGEWITKTSAAPNVMTNPIIGQNTVEWQAMSYGALGDAGPWSEIAQFFTVGAPKPPVITGVSNNNRPTISFTAQNVLSWEMEILQAGNVVYSMANLPYTSQPYLTTGLFQNGTYTVRIRTANQYGYTSSWTEYVFTINTMIPAYLDLDVARNDMDYCIRLYFNNTKYTVYIYRSLFDEDNYIRIAKVNNDRYEDWTAAPGTRYKYFVRIVTDTNNFADSNIVSMKLNYPETTIASVNDRSNLLKMLWQLGSAPDISQQYQYEKSFLNVVGRQSPVVQLGNFISRTISLSFYVSRAERDALHKLTGKDEILILRDKRHGTIFGQVDGQVNSNTDINAYAVMPDTHVEKKINYVVSFVFRESDFDEQVPL